MNFNKHHTIRLYLLAIFIIVSCVFASFLVANFFATAQNTSYITTLQERELPLIQKTIEIQRETEKLKVLFSDAIAFESEFLIEEARDHTQLIASLIDDLEGIHPEKDNPASKIRRALIDYDGLATALTEKLIENSEQLDAFSESAQRTNASFLKLERLISITLSQQQERYAQYLEEMNQNFKDTHKMAALIGLALIVFLFVFSRFISGRIMKAIEKADHLKESFLLTVSHEFRTPLNGIKGAIDLMKPSSNDAEQKDLIDIAKTSLTKMTHVVDDLLLFTELTSGTPKAITAQCRPNDSIQDILSYIKSRCREKHIELEVSIAFPTEEIECDERKVLQILWQLLSNAVEYTESGRISLKTRGDTELDSLTFTITDSGPGISEEYLETLYTPFVQQNRGWSRQHQGLGIGLPMARKLVDCLKGSMSIENRADGNGVTASFSVPCSFVNQSPTDYKASASSTQPSTMSVLIVEDNNVNQIVFKKMIDKLGLSSVTVDNGLEAVEIMKKQGEDFSMVFMDCQMPIMDGFEATQQIRNMSQFERIPIVAVTANALDEDKERCFKVGMNAVVEKPANMSHIKNIIRDYASPDAAQPSTCQR